MPQPRPEVSEFDRLMRRLVQVPKPEIEAEEAKWQALRERLKKRGEAKKRGGKKGRAQ